MSYFQGHILKPGKVSRSKTAYSFSAIVVMEVLVAARSVSSTLLNRILPFIAKCFENDSPEEYEVFMVVHFYLCSGIIS